MAVPKGTSIGIDLSNPVRVAVFSHSAGQVQATYTAKTHFEPGSKSSLKNLADEIRSFYRPLGIKPFGAAGLPMSDCLLFTVAMPKLSKKEFQKAVQFEIERQTAGGPDIMRSVTQEWPEDLPVPPSVKVPEGNTLHLVVAANVESTLSARALLKMARVRPLGVEISANSTSRAGQWLWQKSEPDGDGENEGLSNNMNASAVSGNASVGQPGPDAPEKGSGYMPWVTHGNGGFTTPLPEDLGVAATVTSGVPDVEPVGPAVDLDISIVARAAEATMYLSYGTFPWLMREIPLDPDNPFVNGQILSGEITRSARFARASSQSPVEGRVTVIGESDRVSFLVDFLKEQTGLPTRLWGQPYVDSDPEYGVAVGLALLHQGGAES